MPGHCGRSVGRLIGVLLDLTDHRRRDPEPPTALDHRLTEQVVRERLARKEAAALVEGFALPAARQRVRSDRHPLENVPLEP